MQYLVAHHLHVACVVISVLLFALRGALMIAGSTYQRAPVLRVLPHAVDTLLLTSALWLASILYMSPFRDAWLAAKVLGLVAYVVLGSLALRPGRSRPFRLTAFAAALATIGWIASVAVTKSPWGFLGRLATH